jgi:hypothetical protein
MVIFSQTSDLTKRAVKKKCDKDPKGMERTHDSQAAGCVHCRGRGETVEENERVRERKWERRRGG